MESIKKINMKNRYDMINIKYFDSNLRKIDKKSYKSIDISYVNERF